LDADLSTISNPADEKSRASMSASVEDASASSRKRTDQLDLSRLSEVLAHALDWNVRVMVNGTYGHVLDLVCLSVASLGEFLCAYFGILGEDKWLGSTKTNYLFERMLDDGWCPIEIIRLNAIAGLPEIYFASSSERPGPTRDHRSCRARIPLEQMDEAASFVAQLGPDWKCTAYDMDWKTYRTEHAPGCSQCPELSANQAQMEQILEGGYFPLLSPACVKSKAAAGDDAKPGSEDVQFEADGRGLRLTSTETVKKYVCISHVWSDGLGNPHRNSIPRCQYERLSGMVDKLYPDEKVPFWIDTICVPREPWALRRQTIMLMGKTYSEAEAVLILDKYLLDLDLDARSEREAWVRILNCGWMRRLWTLQECALARRALFQLRNGTLDLDNALWFDVNTNDTWTLQWVKLRGSWGRSSDTDTEDDGAGNMLGVLSDVLAWRSTSIAEDEAVCLSIITGLDSSEIGQVIAFKSHEDRMTQFWRLTKSLSSEILFWDGPRLSQPGMRWAPRTFLDKGPTPFLQQRSQRYQRAQLTGEGLRVKLPGLLLGKRRGKLREISFLRSSSNAWYRLVTSYMNEPASLRPPATATTTAAGDTHLGFILQEPELSFVDDLPFNDSLAVLVVLIHSSQPEGAGVIFAKPLCVGTIERAERYQGWIGPLEELRSRFYSKARAGGGGSLLDSAENFELDGTLLGHSNSDATTGSESESESENKSDIKAFWTDGHLSIDLKNEQVMCEIVSGLEQQEWCVG
jgi:hypothetical protein